jgi:hypothetical protein
MATEKAVYWIAICVMTVGLGNTLVKHNGAFVQNIGRRAMVLAGVVSDRTQGQLEQANLVMDRTQAGFDRGQAQMARAQARMVCLQTRLARHQAELASVQAARARLAVSQRIGKIVVTVPEISSRTGVVGNWSDDSGQ